jgi:hypothetical protein
MSKWDISKLDDLKDSQPSVFINSEDLDLFFLKTLYENCLRMGSTNNTNVTHASIHPTLWFSEFFEKYSDCIKMVSKNSSFEIIKIIDNKITTQSYSSQFLQFDTDEKLDNFFLQYRNYKNLVLFSVIKLLDLQTLKSVWHVRARDITTKEEMRNLKIDEII